ncbi:hypothetical protein GGU11DRAFT_793103 [Lentinula aff. detonsa]|nr:hypothetical protein GGU11DRAFT_793103 [Lentinula aff. detonsa]
MDSVPQVPSYSRLATPPGLYVKDGKYYEDDCLPTPRNTLPPCHECRDRIVSVLHLKSREAGAHCSSCGQAAFHFQTISEDDFPERERKAIYSSTLHVTCGSAMNTEKAAKEGQAVKKETVAKEELKMVKTEKATKEESIDKTKGVKRKQKVDYMTPSERNAEKHPRAEKRSRKSLNEYLANIWVNNNQRYLYFNRTIEDQYSEPTDGLKLMNILVDIEERTREILGAGNPSLGYCYAG